MGTSVCMGRRVGLGWICQGLKLGICHDQDTLLRIETCLMVTWKKELMLACEGLEMILMGTGAPSAPMRSCLSELCYSGQLAC